MQRKLVSFIVVLFSMNTTDHLSLIKTKESYKLRFVLRKDNEARTRNLKDDSLNILSFLQKMIKKFPDSLNLYAPDICIW